MKPYTSVSCGYEPENLLPHQVEKDDLKDFKDDNKDLKNNNDHKVIEDDHIYPSVLVVARVLSIESVRRSSSKIRKSKCKFNMVLEYCDMEIKFNPIVNRRNKTEKPLCV